MGLLNFDDIKIEKKGKSPIAFGVAAIAVIAAIGLATASLITINTGSEIEFGQGVVQTVSCDSGGINVTPVQSFVNINDSGKFIYNEIDIEDIASTCVGKDFVIKILDENGNAQSLSSGSGVTYNQVRIYFAPLTASSEVDINGTMTGMFELVGTGSEVLGVEAISGLDQIDTELDPELDWDGLDPVPFWRMSATSNSVQIVFNPDPSGASGLDGFADSRLAYRISVESMDHAPR